MLRKDNAAGMTSCSFVNATFAEGSNWSSPWTLVLANVMEDRVVGFAVEELKEIGDRWKSSDEVFDACKAGTDECLSIKSTKRFCVRGSFEGSGGSNERGIGAK